MKPARVWSLSLGEVTPETSQVRRPSGPWVTT